MKWFLKYFFTKLIDWLFRPKSPEVMAMRISGGLLTALLVGEKISGMIVSATSDKADVSVTLSQGGQLYAHIFNITIIILLVVFFLAFIAIAIKAFREHSTSSKKSVVVIEGRGLRDDDGNPLINALGAEFPKNRISILLDLRQNLDGKIVSPETLLPKVGTTKELLNQVNRGKGRENVSVVYGGLTAVPFTFLTGVELDDESEISIFDWDRTAESWRQLDADDDGKRLSAPDLQTLGETENVVLAISVSYPISDDDIATSFDYPIVRAELDGASSNSHWSTSKQSALADQFFEISKELSAKGIKNIHLILAAPNSVTFQFGRRYDKRNLPNLVVYQYERSHELKYPWGIQMPIGGSSTRIIQVPPRP